MDIFDLHARALDETARIIEGITSAQMMAPTPCTEWSVRTLLNHLVAGNRRFARLPGGGSGMPSPEARTQDHLGDDPAGAYRASAEALKQAWRQPGALGGMYTVPIGTLPGPAVLQLHAVETVVHGWDLARATGQGTDLDPDLARQLLENARAFLPDAMRGPDGQAPFGPRVDVPESAAAADQLAGFLGRPV